MAKVKMIHVITAISCLAGITLVCYSATTLSESTHRSQCTRNLKQIGLAIYNYNSAQDAMPAGTAVVTNLAPEDRVGWMLVILPYVEVSNRMITYNVNSCWSSPAMRHMLTDQSASLFRCPSGSSVQVGDTNLTGIAGLGTDAATLPIRHPRAGVFGYERAAKCGDITDGLSNTMMVAETIHNNGPWIAGGSIAVRGLDPSKPPYIGGRRGQFGGTHSGGANVLFADGSVKFIRQSISPKTFEALSMIAGGEPIPSQRGF